MKRAMETASLDGAFFPVSEIELLRSDTRSPLRGHVGIVPRDGRGVFAVVTRNYQLVSNEEACELGQTAFALAFGKSAAADLRPFNLLMPRTRSWAQIDFTSDVLCFEPRQGDRWVPFLRVTNSYNRTRALQLSLGVCRWICTNGMIFGERSLTLRNPHQRGAHLPSMLKTAFASARPRLDLLAVKDRLTSLSELAVPVDRFVAGSLEILGLRVPEEIPPRPMHAAGWPELGPHLRKLGKDYVAELGENAYALLSAASDYASDVEAPRMNPTLVNGLQTRCGRWAERTAARFQASKDATLAVEPDSLAAAERLAAFSKASGI